MAGKLVSSKSEETVFAHIKGMVTKEEKAYYIIWKYAPQLIVGGEKIKTFNDLKTHFSGYFNQKNLDEKEAEGWLMLENVQSAVKWLLKRENQAKMIELYNVYYDKAKDGDVQSFKAFVDFQKEFFKDGENQSELQSLINNIKEKDLEVS